MATEINESHNAGWEARQLPSYNCPASENPALARYLSREGSDKAIGQIKIEEAIEAEGEPERGGPRRFSRAEIERGEAEAIRKKRGSRGGAIRRQ